MLKKYASENPQTLDFTGFLNAEGGIRTHVYVPQTLDFTALFFRRYANLAYLYG